MFTAHSFRCIVTFVSFLVAGDQVACFSALPNLSTLLLNHNRISDVMDMASTSTSTTATAAAAAAAASAEANDSPGPASEDQVKAGDVRQGCGKTDDAGVDAGSSSQATNLLPFATLEAISLSGNRIEDWGAIDRLAGLPYLRSLRFSSNPVTSGLGASEVKHLVSIDSCLRFGLGVFHSSTLSVPQLLR